VNDFFYRALAFNLLLSAPPTRPDWVHEIRHDDIYPSGKYKDRLKFKNPDAPAMRRETEEDWGGERMPIETLDAD
jgi:hypothetical protein